MPITISSVFLVLTLFLTSFSFAQNHHLYELEKKLMKGEKAALHEIGKYLDSKEMLSEYLGYHHLRRTEATIATRIIEENCMFLPSEFAFDKKTRKKDFLTFLNENKAKITFSSLAGAFVITPFKDRTVAFEITALTDKRKNDLLSRKLQLMNLSRVTANGIDQLIRQKDPRALLEIAGLLLRGRNRFNKYQRNSEELVDLLELLTGTSFAVLNEKGEMSRQIAKDYDPESRKNLLSFFARNCDKYHWDERKSVFAIPLQTIRQPSNERALFELLNHKDDQIALDAFIDLTKGDPETVPPIAEEYKSAHIRHNDALPTFPYRFLKQLAPMTAWFREKGIDYQGSAQMKAKIERLKSRELSFKDRYQLENEVIASLSLDEVTALEYWAIIYGGGYSGMLSFSAGRILDVFYSRHWNEMMTNPLHLETFLKKSHWYNQLGIIGTCNLFLVKFSNASPETLEIISQFETNDPAIRKQLDEIAKLNEKRPKKRKTSTKEWDGNKDYPPVTDLEGKLKQLTDGSIEQKAAEHILLDLLSEISYEQIGTTMKGIEQFNFEQDWHKYSFMKRDWGFFDFSFEDEQGRKEFLDKYESQSEYELYAGMLDNAEIDYQKTDGSLDYDKVYEMLKYDVVVAFVGGGGGKIERQVYALIKLLELKFETTLGYPRKLCNSRNTYGCYADDRAADWMKYLKENGLLEKDHDEPVSYTYGLD